MLIGPASLRARHAVANAEAIAGVVFLGAVAIGLGNLIVQSLRLIAEWLNLL